MNRFRAIREESNRKGIAHQYRIVFASNVGYTVGRIRYETYGPKGAGWNVRCSDCDEDLQSAVLEKFWSDNNRQFPLARALELFKMAFEELEAEQQGQTC